MERVKIPFRNNTSLAGFLYQSPVKVRGILVLAHGANQLGQNDPFLINLAQGLGSIGLECLTFDFPFVSEQRSTPNSETVLVEALDSALRFTGDLKPGSRVLVGGKSLGAKIALKTRAGVSEGAVLLGYPLHPAGAIGLSSNNQLLGYQSPIFLVNGTRDPQANPGLLRDFVASQTRIGLLLLEGADQGLRSPGGSEEIIQEILVNLDPWLTKLGF